MFEMAVRQNVYEERQNQLRWQVKVGDESISVKARQQVIEAREDAWIQYRVRELLTLFSIIFYYLLKTIYFSEFM